MGYKKIDKKVFDYSDMPEDVQSAFDDEMIDSNQRGSTYIQRDVYNECYDGSEDYVKVKDGEVIWRECEDRSDPDYKNSKMLLIRGNDVVSDWLLDNGGEIWEEVLIKSYW